MSTSPAQFPILVIDDEPTVVDLLSRIASSEFPQAQFICTRSPQETIDYFQQSNGVVPRLILLDINFQREHNGLELLTDLRVHLGRVIPIIVLSVLSEEATVQQAYAQGAVAYTQKPEDLLGWQRYVQMLRDYWYLAARLPVTSPY